MPRVAREKSSTNFYHVIMRGINQEAIFYKSVYKRKMIHTILKKQEDYPIEVYGYCIMNNHIHLLVRCEISVLSTFIACINTTYALYYNQVNRRIGYVFQDRFKSYPIESESYYWTCLRYIHNNPVKAKICQKPEGYKWSSFNGYIDKRDLILNSKAYLFMGKTYPNMTTFSEYHQGEDFNLYPDVEEDYKIIQEGIVIHIVELIMDKYGIKDKWDIAINKQATNELKKKLKDNAKLKQGEIRKYLAYLQE